MQSNCYNVLHPFSFMPDRQTLEKNDPFFTLYRGKGSWVFDETGNKYLYTTTAVPTVGLGNEVVLERIRNQYETLSFASTCEQNHPLTNELAGKLLQLAGEPFDMVFFTTDGSGAVETSMRLARQHFISTNQPERIKFISVDGNYHGTTYGSGSVTNLGIQSIFGPGLEGCFSIPSPADFSMSSNISESINEKINKLEELINIEKSETIAAVALELVQGVNGIIPMPQEFVQAVRKITEKHGILLIIDEVTTGIGRTGHWLASHYFGIKADLLTLSKGLTGGYFPMGATLISEQIRDALFSNGGVFLHGSTQSGHPVGCAAALAVLEIMENENLVKNSSELGKRIKDGLMKGLENHPSVLEIRGEGLMLAIEFVENKADKQPVSMDWSRRFTSKLRDEGILGNFFNSIFLMYPPLNITVEESDYLVQGVCNAAWTMVESK
ncbi:MAG: aspartate aminotransferase family protein [Bacillota bacterium]